LLLPIDVKTLLELYLGDESLNERYEYDLERKKCEMIPANSNREISVVDILRQIDIECPSPGETPPSSPSIFYDNESSENNISSVSDYEETLKEYIQTRK
ncbi:16527_t:CDS:2, partial [Funneliformis geosporum]